jgi:hypothetical protein
VLFGDWLEQTAKLQRTAYGADFALGSTDDPYPLDWLGYVREQTLAAFVELGEFIQNLSWKPWAKDPRLPTGLERADAIEELVDVLHFVANDLYALGVTDAELNYVYEEKMEVNRDRMAGGGH